MSLTTKDHLSLTIQAIKTLLSHKADKTEVIFKSEIQDPIEISAEMGLVEPASSDDGAIYTDEHGVLYTL